MLVEIWNRNIDISLLFLSVCFCFFLNKFTSVCGCFFYEIREILRRTLSYFFLEAMEKLRLMAIKFFLCILYNFSYNLDVSRGLR